MDCTHLVRQLGSVRDRARAMTRHANTLWLVLALWAAIAIGAAAAARAIVVQALTLPELVKASELVLVATPGERQARMTNKLIFTDVSLHVAQALKGNAKSGDTVVATLMGGTLDSELALQVPGEASLPEGRELLVFLERSPSSGDLRVVGMAQGVMPIEKRAGNSVVKPPSGSAHLMRRDDSGALKAAEPAIKEEIGLPDLVQRIRSLVASEAGTR
jgi:hypothetical protein